MKVRSRINRRYEEIPSYWPSFVDIMTTVALVFFFIMIMPIRDIVRYPFFTLF